MRGSDRRPGARAARRPFNQAGEPTTPTAATNFDASNRLSIDSAAYNAAGNQTAIAGFTNTFDAENRLLTSTLGGVTTTYTYDGDGRRVQKATGGATTTYVYDAAGDLAAEYSTAPPAPPCTTCYLTEDHLGSTRMMTDASGALKSLHDYVPFGEEIQAGVGGRSSTYYPPGSLAINDTVAQKFTGKERDVETGLDYFGARYYASPQGRFTSPDPLGILRQKLRDPQQWNMYSYTRNNPLRLFDPTGMYVTSCKETDVSKCDANTQAFEAARQRDLSSDDRSIRKAAAAYGNYGQAGVNVQFQDQKAGGGEVTFDRDASGKATGTLTVNITPGQLAEAGRGTEGQAGTDAVVAHEGVHVGDDMKLIKSGYDTKYDITHLKTEEHAYRVSNRVLETEVNRTNPAWQSNKAIENFVREHPGMYPHPDDPILKPEAVPAKGN